MATEIPYLSRCNSWREKPDRNKIIERRAKVNALLQIKNLKELQESLKRWIEEALESKNHNRQSKWTESISVGNKGFVEATKKRLGIRAKGRKVFRNNGAYELREPAAPYKGVFDPENGLLRLENTYF